MKNLLFSLVTITLLTFGCDNGTDPKLAPLELTVTKNNVSVEGGSDGSINLTVEGGEKPYSFEWSNGLTTEDIDNLLMGTYSVTVTDSKGSSETITVEIKADNLIVTVTDIDGNIYQTIKIGNQIWMAENLRVTNNPSGNEITSYVYNSDPSNESIYGRLYTWNSAMNGSTQEKSQGIAPDGWHIPSDTEWQELFDYLGGISIAGGKMKATGTDYWNPPNSNATNSSGFSSLPAGGGYPLNFEGIGEGTHYWSSTSVGSNVTIPTIHSGTDILLLQIPKTYSISVRCIKD